MTHTMPPYRRAPTVLNLRRIGVVVLLAGLLIVGGVVWVLRTQTKPVAAAVADIGNAPGWVNEAMGYPVVKDTPPVKDILHDKTADELAALKAALARQQQELDALKKRPTTTPAAQPPPPVVKKVAPSMLFVDYTPKEGSEAKKKAAGKEYTLAPGATKLVGILETAVNSDVPGYLTCKISTNIYDTATGKHLLVPQGSTVLGHDQSADLLYGNTRLPTVSLTLALPDGRSVDLGRAPIVDQEGAAGLSGDVDNHWGRLVGAVIVGGALRGGQQALQVSLAEAGGAGQVVSGIGAVGSQAGQQRAGRALDTRPTITVKPGDGCVVLLIKPLMLPPMWE